MIRFSPRRILSLAFALLIVCLAFGLAACGGGEEEQESISPINKIPTHHWIARIDGHEISGAWLRNWAVTEVHRFESSGLPMNLDECSMIREGRELLTKLVIVALEAERRGITVSDEEVSKALSKEMSRFPSTEMWLKVLKESGLTREDRKEQIRLEALFFRYQNEVVGPEVYRDEANDEQVRAFYDTYREEVFSRPRRVHLRHIQRSAARDAPESERQHEREILSKARERALGGASFEELAKELSTDASALKGGDIGWLDESVPVLPEFKKALLELEAGGISPVLDGPQGFHLFQAVEVKPAGILPYEEVKEEVRKRLFSEAIKRRMGRHALELREQLIAAKKIEFFNLIPFTGCAMTPKEAQQIEELEKAAKP